MGSPNGNSGGSDKCESSATLIRSTGPGPGGAGFRFFYAALFLISLAFLPSPCAAQSVTLAWDENSEPDIAGYKVYYRLGSSGSGVTIRYNGTGLENGGSPIDLPGYEDENLDPRYVEITLNGLNQDEDYYFVVTAYNLDGLESAPSNEAALLRAPAANSGSPGVDPTAQDYSSAAAGGGGGGCFISSVWERNQWRKKYKNNEK